MMVREMWKAVADWLEEHQRLCPGTPIAQDIEVGVWRKLSRYWCPVCGRESPPFTSTLVLTR